MWAHPGDVGARRLDRELGRGQRSHGLGPDTDQREQLVHIRHRVRQHPPPRAGGPNPGVGGRRRATRLRGRRGVRGCLPAISVGRRCVSVAGDVRGYHALPFNSTAFRRRSRAAAGVRTEAAAWLPILPTSSARD